MPAGPIGIRLVDRCYCSSKSKERRTKSYKIFVLLFTFLIYTIYHMSRKPFSVVKSVLNQNCTKLDEENHKNHTSSTWCDWKPFDGDNSSILLGALDSSFLFAYAFSMFFSGFFAERSNLRYYLTGGMSLSALSVFLFGFGYWVQIHNFYFYAAVMFFGGVVQTSGWPAVVTCVGNWFGKKKRGLIFGIWNAHTSAGNILGSVIAGAFVTQNWGLSFAIPAAIMFGLAILVFLFLPPYPEDIDCSLPNHNTSSQVSPPSINNASNSIISSTSINSSSTPVSGDSSENNENSDSADENSPMVTKEITQSGTSNAPAVSMFGALKIPGVIEFALCLLFAKLVSYTFLYWLPRYINSTHQFNAEHSADISTVFDFGGIIGSIIAGLISDVTGGSATICIIMLFGSIPMLYIHQFFGSYTFWGKMALLCFTGALVNGPYALITTAVSAELGTSSAVRGNAKALSTVTAIIDGTGSIGAAIGPLLAGILVPGGWSHVFYMLMVSQFFAGILVVRISIKEVKRYFQNFSAVRDCGCFYGICSPCCSQSSPINDVIAS